MNILIPDSWLREFLKTDATPKQLKEYVSLCGPSIERVNTVHGETVYDIEITTNRVDSYSVMGIAREAATILPRLGVKAHLLTSQSKSPSYGKKQIDISIDDPGHFCRRILAAKIEKISLGSSPEWFQKRLELAGQRPLNNIVDITNYVMWEIGHPVHAFDFDRLVEKKILVREANKGEKVISLDGKKHTMIGGELIFDDGTGTIIDIPGIMGTANTIVTPETKNVLLFIENSDPSKIRFTSMAHAIRTQAAVINEKDPDPELALTAMNRSVSLALELTHGTVQTALFDHYPKKYTPASVSVSRAKLNSYIGTSLPDKEISHILTTLGFDTTLTDREVTVVVPSFRRDVTIDVDVIEEVARIYGYHTIETHLPSMEPPVVAPDPLLTWEQAVKERLRDWGYTEMYTYSMISADQMDLLELDKKKAYKIANPLSSEWEYMRPALWPSLLTAISSNLRTSHLLQLFELSNIYTWRAAQLPLEQPVLVVAWSGEKFSTAKGLAEALFDLTGIPFPKPTTEMQLDWYQEKRGLSLGQFGSIGIVNESITAKFGIKEPVTILELDFMKLINSAKSIKSYIPISKYPPAVEDLAFIVPDEFQIGPFMERLESVDPLITRVTLLDSHKQTRTVHVEYADRNRNLTAEDIRPVREKLLKFASDKFGAILKNI